MKLSKIIKYNCYTYGKSLLIFYTIFYLILLLLFITASGYVNGGEISTIIFIVISCSIGFSVNFKMLIQNGFIRKNIYFSTIITYSFMSILMAIIESIMSILLNMIESAHYTSLFEIVYSVSTISDNILAKILWIASLYFLIVSLSYLCSIIYNKIGKIFWLFFGGIVAILNIILPMIFSNFLTPSMSQKVYTLILKVFGFSNGKVNIIYPIILFVLVSLITNVIGYIIIKKLEIK